MHGVISPEHVLYRYVNAANAHNLSELRRLIAHDAVWELGGDTLTGIEEIMKPHKFDEGAETHLEIRNLKVEGDMLHFEFVETNKVLKALRIDGLHHFARMRIINGKIHEIAPFKLPEEHHEFVKRMTAFGRWLKQNDSDHFEQIWAGGNFAYTIQTARIMPSLIEEWIRREGLPDLPAS